MTLLIVDEPLARTSSRERVRTSDATSGSVFERLVIDGERYFMKRLSPASDWIMRVGGDHVHRPYLAWQAGLMDGVPACIDHTVVAMQVEGRGDDAVLGMVMRDVAEHLVPEGDAVVPAAQHRGFIEHLALCAAFWDWRDSVGLATMPEPVRLFAPDNIAAELTTEPVPGPIAAADAGWRAHSKMGNLGTHPDGRTILVDWALPGSGPACGDLGWYLALNRSRLPEPKHVAIERFRGALEARGVDTTAWRGRQLDLCVVAIMSTFGWEKALGDGGELRWWEGRVAQAIGRQALEVSGAQP